LPLLVDPLKIREAVTRVTSLQQFVAEVRENSDMTKYTAETTE